MQIHWVHAEPLAAELREATEKRLAALAEGHTDLIDVRITTHTSGHHRHGGQEVRIVCEARGKEIVTSSTRPEAAQALDDALEALERAVRERRTRRNGVPRPRAGGTPELGIIDRVFRDGHYGFILTDAGEQVYFHRNALHGGLAFESLAEGQRVGLAIEPGDQGLQASAVRPAPPDTPAP